MTMIKFKLIGGKNMSLDIIKNAILSIADSYPIKRVVLFGSRANGTNKDDSDIDLIFEFTSQISLLTLSKIKVELEELLGLKVDIIHGPILETDIIEVGKEIELYAA